MCAVAGNWAEGLTHVLISSLVNLKHGNAVWPTDHRFWNCTAKAHVIWKSCSLWPPILRCLTESLLCYWSNLHRLGMSLLWKSVGNRVLHFAQSCSPWMQSLPRPWVFSFGEAWSMAVPPAHSWNQLKVLWVSKKSVVFPDKSPEEQLVSYTQLNYTPTRKKSIT